MAKMCSSTWSYLPVPLPLFILFFRNAKKVQNFFFKKKIRKSIQGSLFHIFDQGRPYLDNTLKEDLPTYDFVKEENEQTIHANLF